MTPQVPEKEKELEQRLAECEAALSTVEAAAKEAQDKLAGRRLVEKLKGRIERDTPAPSEPEEGQ